MKASKSLKNSEASAAVGVAEDGFARIDAVHNRIEEVQAEHSEACARRAGLVEEHRVVGDRLADAESRAQVAKRNGREPSDEADRAVERLSEQCAAMTREVGELEKRIENKSAELRELQTIGLQSAFSGGSIDEVLRAQRDLERALDEARTIRSAIEKQRALRDAAPSGSEERDADDGGESLSDLLAKAALGQADPAKVERKRTEVAAKKREAQKAVADREAREAVIQETLDGLERTLAANESTVALLKKRCDQTFAQFVATEQESAAAQYGQVAGQLAALLDRMIALDEIGRRRGVPPLLNENWPSCFVLPSVRRDAVEAQEHPNMPGVLATGVLLAQPKAREVGRTAERDRMRGLGVTLF